MKVMWQNLRDDARRLFKRPVIVLLAVITLAIGLGAAQIAPEPPRRLPAGYVKARGTAMDAVTGLPKRIIHKASGIALVLIPAGEFVMGSPPSEANRLRDEDQHRRIIRQAFYMGETEVTVAQFRRFVTATKYQTDAEAGTPLDVHRVGSFAAVPGGDRAWSLVANWRNPFPNLPEYRRQDDHPVIHVSWNDAKRFSQHFGFQLPTEAQWEYAARAGTQTSYFWGEQAEDGARFANVNDAQARRRFKDVGQAFSFDDGAALVTKVGSYRPNAWGLYDMVGNIVEWVEDAYVRCYPGDGADESAATNDVKSGRVLRGGSWLDSQTHTRSAVRVTMTEAARRDFIGFRVVKKIEP
jgi:formylglycine-generating enzyme required for sulfatase activity